MATWEEIVKLRDAGKIIDIGTSNHTRATMELLLRDVSQKDRPVMNQMEMHPLFQQTELRRYFESEGVATMGYMSIGSPKRPGRDRFKEHRNDMADPTILAIAEELGVSPGAVCLSWAIQRENKSGGFVAMSTTPKRIHSNLKSAIDDILSDEHIKQISGDGTDENQGIDANNRLIWGQVFLWEETGGDWRVLWDDSQVFETRTGYQKFKKAWADFDSVKIETTYRASV